MKPSLRLAWTLPWSVGCFCGLLNTTGINRAQPDPNWLEHDRARPQPARVSPGTFSTQEEPGRPPGDAVVLFDGKDLSAWAGMDGTPTKWIVKDGYMECVKGSGYVRTLQNFGDCQLHIEWAAPVPAEGKGQGRGNSGVFFGLDRYEVQVLDSYENATYADGSAGSVYGQYAPLVNVCRPPGQWQTYDILYTAPRFAGEGKVSSPARLTVFQNGVVIQQNVELTGPTSWLERASYRPHPEKTPISLQDHGNPVRYRNIWIRELGPGHRNEFTYGDALLDRYTGSYEREPNNFVTITREHGQLVLTMDRVRFVLFAESKTKFFAKTTDVQCEFQPDAQGQVDSVIISVGEGGMTARRRK
ncbi:MAG: family 16 glycoside hydrolase [Verrucomicrobiota bacterium]